MANSQAFGRRPTPIAQGPSDDRDRHFRGPRREVYAQQRSQKPCTAKAARHDHRAQDTRRCHTAILDRQVGSILPIRKNERRWKEDCPAAITKNTTLLASQLSRYHADSRIKAKMPPALVRSHRWRLTGSTSKPLASTSLQDTLTAEPSTLFRMFKGVLKGVACSGWARVKKGDVNTRAPLICSA